jgi:hypothetical protein
MIGHVDFIMTLLPSHTQRYAFMIAGQSTLGNSGAMFLSLQKLCKIRFFLNFPSILES